ncbi:MAG TPA: 50S ribosomal protein L32e [Candidatus Acidoferrales bacterium]|nr:50S ribosomal protein L32e [Candidatus Acidoferrales bacterium]
MTEPKAITPKRVLKLRERVKKGKPKFARPESWRYVRLKENWRNPRGLDNKVRMYIKGWPPPVSSGYGGPRVSRGLHASGYEEILVYNVEQVSKVTPGTQALRIAHAVGKRKRTQILAEARKRKIVVLNLRQAREAAGEKSAGEKEEEGAKEAQEQPKEAEEALATEKAQPEKKANRHKEVANDQ